MRPLTAAGNVKAETEQLLEDALARRGRRLPRREWFVELAATALFLGALAVLAATASTDLRATPASSG